jgi:DNA-binding response OmpR family regulator
LLTARGQFDDLAHGYGEGAHWYVHKPFDMAELESFVFRLIGLPDLPAMEDPDPADRQPVAMNGTRCVASR